jgi:DNA-binding beta-propeller fold protein YncE
MNKFLKLVAITMVIFGLIFFVGCKKDEDVETIFDSFLIQTVMSLDAGAAANAEIVRVVPDSDNLAVFVSSAINRLTVIEYTKDAFVFANTYDLNPGSATAEMTSLDVSKKINGENYVAVCVAEADCGKGSILFVKLSDGTIVKTVEVGYNPDGTAFTKDGKYLVVACEDDREDRPCKPVERHGGSVSIIDLRNGPANATLLQDYPIDWDDESEPEHCETDADGNVIMTVQETSQVVIFNVADVPLTASDLTIVDLPPAADIDAEPDGLYISPDGEYALISNERSGSFQMMELPSGNLLGTPYIIEGDLPSNYNIDARKAKKRTEPEECALIERDDHLYAVFALQESHGVVVYDVTDPANPVFDSIAEAGIDWENDMGMEKSAIGSEGLGAHQTNGVLFSANEREGSITMFTAAWGRE